MSAGDEAGLIVEAFGEAGLDEDKVFQKVPSPVERALIYMHAWRSDDISRS